VIVRLDVVERNIRRVHGHLARQGIAIRPHVKTHKIPALGRLQMAAGAVGITCQKLGEVEVFADAGVADDVLLTFNVIGRAKIERLLALSRRLRAPMRRPLAGRASRSTAGQPAPAGTPVLARTIRFAPPHRRGPVTRLIRPPVIGTRTRLALRRRNRTAGGQAGPRRPRTPSRTRAAPVRAGSPRCRAS